MNRLNILLAVISTGMILIFSCKKKDAVPAPPTTPLVFSSMAISPDTIAPGETATVTTAATGDNLSYQWTTSHGDLFGYGSSVVFGAAPCCAGSNTVFCTVSDGNTSASKAIPIFVANPD
jgi:hypothetical protein